MQPPYTRADPGEMLKRNFWMLSSGPKWHDLPDERYDSWSTLHERFHKWRDDSTFGAVLSRMQLKLLDDGLMDQDTRMIDFNSMRAMHAAARGGKKGLERTARACFRS